jgi:hypothetical protein
MVIKIIIKFNKGVVVRPNIFKHNNFLDALNEKGNFTYSQADEK